MQLQVSLAQMDVVQGDVAANLAQVSAWTAEAARRGSDLLILPELWSTGYDLKNAKKYATDTSTGIFAQLSQLAAENQIAITGSALSLIGPQQYGNTAVYIDAQGIKRAEYSKIHLFGGMAEEKYLTAGRELSLVETPWGKIGLAICYDLRFPEIFRAYALAGAQAVIIVAEWPRPRQAHWRTLLRARAIENQMLIIACNRVGVTGKTEFFGSSTVIDPCGEIVLEAGEQEILLSTPINLDQVGEVRASMPIFSDRRPAAYLVKSA